MRTDVTIDKRQVLCKNASHIGFGKVNAQVGDLIQADGYGIARMIGRVHYAPALESGEQPIRDWILAVALDPFLGWISERWIDPKTVTRVEAPRNHRDIVAGFLSDELVDAPVEEVRQCASDMWGTLDAFRTWKAKNAADLADYEARQAAK